MPPIVRASSELVGTASANATAATSNTSQRYCPTTDLRVRPSESGTPLSCRRLRTRPESTRKRAAAPTAMEPAASVVKRGDGAEDGVVHRPAREVRLRLGRELEDSCDTDLRASVLHVDARHLRVDGRAAHAEGTAHGEAVLLGELPAHEHAVVGALRDGSPSTSRRRPLAK